MRQCVPAKNRTKTGVSDRARVLGWGQRKGVVGREKSGLWMRAVHARARTMPARHEAPAGLVDRKMYFPEYVPIFNKLSMAGD